MGPATQTQTDDSPVMAGLVPHPWTVAHVSPFLWMPAQGLRKRLAKGIANQAGGHGTSELAARRDLFPADLPAMKATRE